MCWGEKMVDRVSLGEILTLQRRPVEVHPNREYAEIGVRSFGKGIFHKQPRTGLEVGDKELYVVKSGDFVLQITFAWEGAVGLASESEDGMYCSTRFPTFRVNEDICDPKYLLNYFRTNAGVSQLGNISPGSAGRNRVLSVKRIPEIFVPLPPLDEQRRIVAHIEALAARIEEARGLRQQAVEEAEALTNSAQLNILRCEGETKVRDFLTVQSGYAFKSDWFTENGVRLVRNINIGHGTINWADAARMPEKLAEEFERFLLYRGDILVSLDRPIISTGVKVARVGADDVPSLLVQRVGRLLFRSKAVLPEFFFAWLRSPNFTSAIDPGRSNGVPHISQKDIERISFAPPPLEEQHRIVAYLDDLQARVDELKRLQADTAAELDALLPSILDRAFKGEL
jgi:type I restriction enzyme, S subunit